MSDTYLDLVNSGVTKRAAKALGLPRPAHLRRTDPASVDVPLLPGPVLVLGGGDDADAVATTLLGWDLDVRRATTPGTRVAGIIAVLTGLRRTEDAGEALLALGARLRDLVPGGRVVTVSRPASAREPAAAAAQHGVDGFLRSLAKELRAGATGNGIVLGDGVGVTAPSAVGTLRFLLSARSAFVDGQFVHVTSERGSAPADWTHPLAGRIAVVTGAARGIGAQIARVLHRDGAHVIGVDVPAAGESLAAVMNEVAGTAVQLDITATDAGRRIIERARARHGRIDVVVHNAGITRDKLLANMTPEQWDPVVAVNVTAQLAMNEAFLAEEGLSPDGLRLVSLASTSGIAGNRGQTNYAYSKAAVIGMTRSLAPVVADQGGTANAVAPGFIETEMTARIPAVTRQVARRLNSLQQGGQPVDVAEAVAFLASPQAGGVNGEVLRVCGQNLVGQ